MVASSTTALGMLRAAGVRCRALSPTSIMADDDVLKVYVRQSPASPANLPISNDASKTLLVAPRLSKSLRMVGLTDPSYTLIGTETGEIIYRGKNLVSFPHENPRSALQRRIPWARYGLLRVLARTVAPRSQAELAAEIGCTQAAVSQAMQKIEAQVEKVPGGWRALNFNDLVREFLATYPGAMGIADHWYSVAPFNRQVDETLRLNGDILLSADAGADIYAPWRIPKLAVAYVHEASDLTGSGFAESAPDFATFVQIVPADPTIWSTAKAYGSNHIVDPLLCAYDVLQTRTQDASEAAEKIIEVMYKDWLANER